MRERDPRDGGSGWQLLVKVTEPGGDFDRVAGGAGRLEVSAHGRMERLLRQTGAPAGLLSNGRTLRLVSAPRGESSGWLDLHVADMVATAGRPIVAALRLLLGETRLLALPRDKRFAALLADSRRFQNEVSERLVEQVLHALYELLRGVQAADDASDRELLREALAGRPDDLPAGMVYADSTIVFPFDSYAAFCVLQPIFSIDTALKKLNLGISAWVRVVGDEDPTNDITWHRSIGYDKMSSGAWGIAIRY